ncbi:ROK family transcriptional regulator [Celeribacter marinus]|uniref:Transcriptional regulator FrcR for fructose utilization, ROK family n=1 Tax=Celeribacter marinus TaxID=1397108 RepID=A0A0N9ZS69_9RHOB|nr:ROK family transcriptional regulator [Celeribacter marinus]ALI56696.1 transcriptional regulator FrcR for fructose utilization, ROK family [Celeribacter marinus]SFK63244.1 transcriptional regulator, MarR family [Celeribacter marinus]
MGKSEVKELRSGVNQIGVRALNERLVMSLIQRHGGMPGSELAKRTDLSAQTVSNILRKLESDGLVRRGEPQRGKVGKPSIPMEIVPDGALSFGLKIGRRSADLAIMNLAGEVLGQSIVTYRYPMPDLIFAYLKEGMEKLSNGLSDNQRARICGVGIAAPNEIWSWVDAIGAPEDFQIWRDINFAKEVAAFTELPLFTENDGTAACRAEYVFGRGREFYDYAYFFVGSFIGGGIVMDSKVIEGRQGNASALGPLRVPYDDGSQSGGECALMDVASLYVLEAAVAKAGGDTNLMWAMPQDWSSFGISLDDWILASAKALAHAVRSVVSVIDFEAVMIDGAFPVDVRTRLVAQTRLEFERLDVRGITVPRIEQARVGGNARVIGAASSPILRQFF